MLDGVLIGAFGGLALGLVISLLQIVDVYRRAYDLGVRHGREIEVESQWGADVREAIATKQFERGLG